MEVEGKLDALGNIGRPPAAGDFDLLEGLSPTRCLRLAYRAGGGNGCHGALDHLFGSGHPGSCHGAILLRPIICSSFVLTIRNRSQAVQALHGKTRPKSREVNLPLPLLKSPHLESSEMLGRRMSY